MPEYITTPGRVILMRDGETEPCLFDHNNGLTLKGKRQVENVVDQMMAAKIMISAVRHAPKLRAEHSALLAARRAGLDLTKVAESKSLVGKAPSLTPALKGLDGTVLLVSHGEEIYTLLSSLTDGNGLRLVRAADAYVVVRKGTVWEPQNRLANHEITRIFSPSRDII